MVYLIVSISNTGQIYKIFLIYLDKNLFKYSLNYIYTNREDASNFLEIFPYNWCVKTKFE